MSRLTSAWREGVSKLRSKGGRLVLKNFSYLSLLVVAQNLIGLLAYPYFIRVVGKTFYGEAIFALNLAGYFTVLVRFGFAMLATRDIAQNEDNPDRVSEIVSTVYVSRFYLLILSALIYFPLISLCNFKVPTEILLFAFFVCVGESMLPLFYFEGIQRMKFIAIFGVSSRLLILGTALIFVREPDHYRYIPLLYAVAGILTSLVATYLIFFRYGVCFVWSPFRKVLSYTKSSGYFFLNNVSVTLTERTNLLLIGLLLSMQDVAYYELSFKIIQIIKTPIGIIAQALFPNFSRSINAKKIFLSWLFVGFVGVIAMLGVWLLGKYAILILGGASMLPAKPVLWTLALVLPIASFGSVLMLTMAVKSLYRQYMLSDIIYFIAYLLLVGIVWWAGLISIEWFAIVLVLASFSSFLYKLQVAWTKIYRSGI